MALIERLMGIENPKIHVHTFFSAAHERVHGAMTRQNAIDAFGMDAAAIAEYDVLAATAPTGTNALQTALKAMWVNRIHAVLILAEDGVAGYNTAAAVRTKLGI